MITYDICKWEWESAVNKKSGMCSQNQHVVLLRSQNKQSGKEAMCWVRQFGDEWWINRTLQIGFAGRWANRKVNRVCQHSNLNGVGFKNFQAEKNPSSNHMAIALFFGIPLLIWTAVVFLIVLDNSTNINR